MLKCNVCQEVKPATDFSADSRRKSGRQARCKPCAAAITKKWRLDNPERDRATRLRWEAKNPERHLFTKFGIRAADKRAIFERQGRVCGACGTSEHGHPRIAGVAGWCLDHCHYTNEIRGVLCWRCNLALGYVNDSTERLQGLIDYLNAARNILAGSRCLTSVSGDESSDSPVPSSRLRKRRRETGTETARTAA